MVHHKMPRSKSNRSANYYNNESNEINLNKSNDIVNPEKEDDFPIQVDALAKMEQGLNLPKIKF